MSSAIVTHISIAEFKQLGERASSNLKFAQPYSKSVYCGVARPACESEQLFLGRLGGPL